MFNTKNLTANIKNIPSAWVFAYYCNVSIDKFDGTDFKINSVFTDTDITPSLSLYYYNNAYWFNDFSSGQKGSAIRLVELLFRLTTAEAMSRIVADYNGWVLGGGVYSENQIMVKDKYRVTGYDLRTWSSIDKGFWVPFNIGSKLLDRYCVKPLSRYQMDRAGADPLVFSNTKMYGYFDSSDNLCKIYQPNTDRKFIKVQNYIQGESQVLGRPYLLYLSSLKDIMSFESLKLDMDTKAPDSENTMLPQEVVEMDLQTYRRILVLFDNDEAGIKAANRYKEMYNITPVFLNYGEKDFSDHMKKFGRSKVARWIVPLIDKHLNQ